MYDKTTHSTALFYNQQHYDLGEIYRSFVAKVKTHVLKPPSDRGDFFSWMLISKETGPLYCSEEADFEKSDECQHMIGFSLQKGWLDKPEEMLKPRMSPFNANYIHYAIMRKDAETDPVKMNLEKGLEASKEKFKALLKKGGPKQEYQMGIMTHISQEEFGFQFPTNFPAGPMSKADKMNQIEEMLADYCQKTEGVFKKQATNEEEAGLITLAQMQEKAK